MITSERILLSRVGGGTGPMKPSNQPLLIKKRGKGANLERRISSWKIRGEKGERDKTPFPRRGKGVLFFSKMMILFLVL